MIFLIAGFLFLLLGFCGFVYVLYLLTNPKPKEQKRFEKSVDKMVKEIIS